MTPTAPLPTRRDVLCYALIALCVMLATSQLGVIGGLSPGRLWTAGLLGAAMLFILGRARAAGLVAMGAVLVHWLSDPVDAFGSLWALGALLAFSVLLSWPPERPTVPSRLLAVTAVVVLGAATTQLGSPAGWFVLAGVALVAAPFCPAATLGVGLVLATHLGVHLLLAPRATLAGPQRAEVILGLLALPGALAIIRLHHGRRPPRLMERGG